MADQDPKQIGQGPRVKYEQKESSPKPLLSDTGDPFWTNPKKKSRRQRQREIAAAPYASEGGDGTRKSSAFKGSCAELNDHVFKV